ncbi:MAG TPA: Fur family transcriptional regulator [Longimicrobiaceae bacterium]|jgi:Fur family ferric uptake transcriptional regulator|nr:Fur family transcriptional regulator [Longimicrobiaceae bacterium]
MSVIDTEAPSTSPYLNLFRRYLRQQGLPITQQREVVADVVFTSSEHLSVEEIEARLKEKGERIGKATIYRTMEILVRSGLVEDHDFGDGFKRYEHLFGQQPLHEHLICTSCRKVVEFRSRDVLRVQDQVSKQHGFLPTRHRLEIYGICADCQQAGATAPRQGLACPAMSF